MAATKAPKVKQTVAKTAGGIKKALKSKGAKGKVVRQAAKGRGQGKHLGIGSKNVSKKAAVRQMGGSKAYNKMVKEQNAHAASAKPSATPKGGRSGTSVSINGAGG